VSAAAAAGSVEAVVLASLAEAAAAAVVLPADWAAGAAAAAAADVVVVLLAGAGATADAAAGCRRCCTGMVLAVADIEEGASTALRKAGETLTGVALVLLPALIALMLLLTTGMTLFFAGLAPLPRVARSGIRPADAAAGLLFLLLLTDAAPLMFLLMGVGAAGAAGPVADGLAAAAGFVASLAGTLVWLAGSLEGLAGGGLEERGVALTVLGALVVAAGCCCLAGCSSFLGEAAAVATRWLRFVSVGVG
jgi:hypothetical protein